MRYTVKRERMGRETNYLKEIEEINEMREYLGLKPIYRGYAPCLECGRLFYTEDGTRERYCIKCRWKKDVLALSVKDEEAKVHLLGPLD